MCGRVFSSLGRFRQVLLNLLSNAIKFTEHGEIGVQILRLEGEHNIDIRVQLSVTGLGISRKLNKGYLNHLAKPIARLPGNTGEQDWDWLFVNALWSYPAVR